MKRYLTFLIFSCTLFFFNHVQAQEQEEGLGPFSLDTVFVADQHVNDAATVTLVSGDVMEQENVAVAYDALKEKPGLHMVQRLGLTGAGLTRLAIRGAGISGPAGLALYVDGRPDPTVSFAHPAPQAHNLDDIERIEVIHGPSPVLHGSGNTGVVNLYTQTPEKGWEGRLMTSGGSFATSENFLTANYGGDRGYLGVCATYRRTAGHINGMDAWVAGGRLKTGYQLNENWNLRLTAAQTRDHFSVYGPFFVPGPFGNPGTTDLDLTQSVVDLTAEGKFGDFDTSLQLWGDALNPRSQVVPEGAKRADVYEMGGRYKATVSPWTTTKLMLGTDVLYAAARNTPAVPPNAPEISSSVTEVGPYVFVKQRVSPFVAFNSGARLTHHSQYGAEPSAEAGLIVYPAGSGSDGLLDGTTLRARITRGFQSPTMQQLFGVFRGTAAGPPNPNLQPERVTQVEAGLQQQFQLGGVRVVYFKQNGENQIQPVQGELQNTGRFTHSGLEAEVHLNLQQVALNLGGAYYSLSENLLRMPRQTVNGGIRYMPQRFEEQDLSVGFYGRYAGNTFDRAPGADSPRIRLDDYLVLDFRVRSRLLQQLYGSFELDNLTNQKYQTVFGIPMPGRSVYAGVGIHW